MVRCVFFPEAAGSSEVQDLDVIGGAVGCFLFFFLFYDTKVVLGFVSRIIARF